MIKINFFSFILVSVMASVSFSALIDNERCARFFQRPDPMSVMTLNTLVYQSLSEKVTDDLQRLFQENEAFRKFMQRFVFLVENAETQSMLMDLAATPLPESESTKESTLLANAAFLETKWEKRLSFKKQKLLILLEILSHTKPTDKFEDYEVMFLNQSILFYAPGDLTGRGLRNARTDLNRYYIVDLLNSALEILEAKRYGISDLVRDPEFIEKMMEVNRKFSHLDEDQSGLSGLYYIFSGDLK